MQTNSNCWMCEGWLEYKFEFNPAMSDKLNLYTEDSQICVHVSIDHYEGQNMARRPKGKPGYEIVKMVPPRKFDFHFSVDGVPVYLKT